ncbi:hypothetical protein KSP39_PZI021147 [Platanthera zijinensis]|uniref:Uncharacterized protein n=1 Tax=Platanthera zijinensis TaxID=2320716 RepID=A0AAP0FWI2_9ASPA
MVDAQKQSSTLGRRPEVDARRQRRSTLDASGGRRSTPVEVDAQAFGVLADRYFREHQCQVNAFAIASMLAHPFIDDLWWQKTAAVDNHQTAAADNQQIAVVDNHQTAAADNHQTAAADSFQTAAAVKL